LVDVLRARRLEVGVSDSPAGGRLVPRVLRYRREEAELVVRKPVLRVRLGQQQPERARVDDLRGLHVVWEQPRDEATDRLFVGLDKVVEEGEIPRPYRL